MRPSWEDVAEVYAISAPSWLMAGVSAARCSPSSRKKPHAVPKAESIAAFVGSG
jgi:hypothetical protein